MLISTINLKLKLFYSLYTTTTFDMEMHDAIISEMKIVFEQGGNAK